MGPSLAWGDAQEEFEAQTTKNPTESSLPGIVIVPGICGSQLEYELVNRISPYWLCDKNAPWSSLWIDPDLFLAWDCFAEDISLAFDEKTLLFSNNTGVHVRAKGWGNTSGIQYLDDDEQYLTEYFKDMVEYLEEELGYQDGLTLRAAPYDWRMSPNQSPYYMMQLKSLIEETYNTTGEPVVLLGHSMGTVYSYYFLTQVVDESWVEHYIDTWVLVSPPIAGASVAIQSLLSGYALGYPIIPKAPLVPVARTWASNYLLLPTPMGYWQDRVFVTNGDASFTAANFSDIFEIIGMHNMTLMYNSSIIDMPSPSLQNIVVFHGENVSTPFLYEYKDPDFSSDPSITYSSGDGTVPIDSLVQPAEWGDHVKMVGMEGNTHNGILNNATFFHLFHQVLQHDPRFFNDH